jgi:hypothetical protein
VDRASRSLLSFKLEGRDPATEKRDAKQRVVADRVVDLLETFIAQRLSKNRSVAEISRLLRREVGKSWSGRSIHEVTKRDVVGGKEYFLLAMSESADLARQRGHDQCL